MHIAIKQELAVGNPTESSKQTNYVTNVDYTKVKCWENVWSDCSRV